MNRPAFIVFLLLALLGLGLAFARLPSRRPPACDFCERATCQGTAYRLRLSFGRARHACCPRCGIRFERQHPGSVHAAWVRDFATGHEIAARQAVYVEDSDFSHCAPGMIARDHEGSCYTKCFDRCFPSLIAFGDEKSADLFRASHGGVIRDFDSLLQE
jgi:hypothetical protein